MKKTTERDSGIELMRIVCMVLIIAHHYGVHGGYPAVTLATLTPGRMMIQCISMYGRLACSMFAMATGYYMIVSPCKNHYRKIVPLAAEMTFYTVCLWLFLPVNKGSYSVTWLLFQCFWGNWYIRYYIAFYFLIPFLNPMLRSLSRKQHFSLLLTLFFAWSIVPTLFRNSWNGCSLDFFAVMYVTGSFIRLYLADRPLWKNRTNLFLGCGFAVFLSLSVLMKDVRALWTQSPSLLSTAQEYMDYYNIPSFLCALFLFLWFSNLHFSSKTVNFIAKSMPGVYLIHDHDLFRPFVWQFFSPNVLYRDAPWIHAPVKIACVFLFCLLLDILRRGIPGYRFDTWFYAHCDEITAKSCSLAPEKVRRKLTEVWKAVSENQTSHQSV